MARFSVPVLGAMRSIDDLGKLDWEWKIAMSHIKPFAMHMRVRIADVLI